MRITSFCGLALAAAGVFLGCDSKTAQRVETAPLAIKQPQEVLQHLRYLGLRRDLKQLPVMAAVDLGDLYNNGRWFHDHAGQMNLTLSAQEIRDLGVEPLREMGYLAPDASKKALQDALDQVQAKAQPKLSQAMEGLDPEKLDKLPLAGEKDARRAGDAALIQSKYLRPMFYAGIYRLVKGVPPVLWDAFSVMDSRPSKDNTRWHEVYLGLEGKPVLQLTLTRQPNGTLGIIYMYFKVSPRKLEQVAAQMEARGK